MDSAVLFDFGGTLDADGIAWKERFHRLFETEGVAVAPGQFDPAFYAADDALVGTVPATLPLEDTEPGLLERRDRRASCRGRDAGGPRGRALSLGGAGLLRV